MIFQKNLESDPTLPTGEHISIIVFSPLKILNPDADRVCFGAIQVKPALEVWLLFIGPFEISLKKTALTDMVFVVVGVAKTQFCNRDTKTYHWWVLQVRCFHLSQFFSKIVENLPFPQRAWHFIGHRLNGRLKVVSLYLHNKVSDIAEGKVQFAGKTLTPCRMH